MRILFITSGSENVGTYFRAYFFACELVEKGHQVTLLCSSEKPSRKLVNVKFSQGVKVVRFYKTRFKWDYIGYLIRGVMTLAYVVRNSYEIMHVFVGWQPPSLVATLTAKIKRLFCNDFRKILIDWDDLWGDGGIAEEHAYLLRVLIDYLEIRVLTLADHVTVCSTFLKERAEKFVSKEITMIYNGSNNRDIYPLKMRDSRQSLGIDPNIKIGLLIGQFQTSVFPKIIKNFEYLFSMRSDLYLYILGGLPDAYLQQLKKSDRRIKYIGKVPHTELKIYFSSADFLIMAMDSTNVERARFPIRFGDYIASGTPIVASPVGEICKLISANNIAIVANIDNKLEYAQKVGEILDNTDKAIKIALNGRRFSEESLSWKILTNQLLAIYA